MADSVPIYKDLETKLILKWVDTEDLLSTQRALIEVTPEAAFLELPRGRRGEKGEKGDAGAQMWIRDLITNRNQLPQNLREVDQGACYVDTNSRSAWVWNGRDYIEIPEFVGVRGEPGMTPRVQIGSVRPGGDASVSVNQAASTEDTFVLDFVLPQGPVGPPGEKGDEGTASNVSNSPDVDMTRPPVPGEALTWNGAKWAPRNVMSPIGPWVLGEGDFTSVSQHLIGSGNVSEKMIASYTVPGLPFDWHPVVLGGQLRVETPIGVQYDAEVRVGNAQRGDIIGRGIGKPYQRREDHTQIYPAVDSRMTPGNAVGVVKANTATTIYVVLKKTRGTIGGWDFWRSNSSLAFMAMPVNQDYS